MKGIEVVWEVFKIISAGLIASGLLGIVFKKSVEGFVKEIFDKALEEYKNELRKTTEESLIRYSKLHKDRAEVIKTIHSHIVAVEGIMSAFEWELEFRRQERKRRGEKREDEEWLEEGKNTVMERYLEFGVYMEKNKLFFEKEMWEKLEKVRMGYKGMVDKYLSMKFEGWKEVLDAREKICELQSDVDEVKENLEEEFRKMLGVG